MLAAFITILEQQQHDQHRGLFTAFRPIIERSIPIYCIDESALVVPPPLSVNLDQSLDRL